MTKVDGQAWYATRLKVWQKSWGTKPSADLINQVHALGPRAGKQAFALAMALRPDEGATASQIIAVCGAAQSNKRKFMIEAGYFKRLPAPDVDGITCYKCELTKRALARIAAYTSKAEKLEALGNTLEGDEVAAKPKAKAKAKVKAKAAKPAKQASGDPVAVTDQPKAAEPAKAPAKAKRASKPAKAADQPQAWQAIGTGIDGIAA